jgi:benzaldehyde dehydrogenase (NAD)
MTLLDSTIWTDKFLGESWTTTGAGVYRVTEPATGRQLGSIAKAAPPDVRVAGAAAATAQQAWAAQPYTERAAVLRRAGDLFLAHAEEISAWLIRESGAIRGRAAFEIDVASQECYEAAALASAPYGELLRSQQDRLSLSRRTPVGVVGVIAPFNVPLILAIRAVAPALALGNTVILKPDPRTAVCGGVSIARVFEEAGLPPGVLQMLPGGAEVGEAIVADPAVRVIAFTGSTQAGRAVGRLAAEHLKRAHLELGGNSALIIMDDVDLDQAASIGAWGSFFNQGQVCMTTGRHLVDARVVDDYLDRLVAHADALTVGDPYRGDVALGPIIDAGQRDKIHGLVGASKDGGACVLAGGTYDELFYRPTVLSGVSTSTPAFRDEVFGPVAPVMSFDSVDELVDIATRTNYGLSLGILSADVGRALEVSARIPSGAVHINDQTVNDEATIPFGGVLDSGTGSRHGGVQANLEAFTDVQWVTLRNTLAQYPF